MVTARKVIAVAAWRHVLAVVFHNMIQFERLLLSNTEP